MDRLRFAIIRALLLAVGMLMFSSGLAYAAKDVFIRSWSTRLRLASQGNCSSTGSRCRWQR